MSDDKKIFKYDGERADVYWDGRLCIHVGECGRAQGDLFVNGRQPWCQPDLSDVDEVDEVVRRCPTGALTAKLADGTMQETAADENVIVVANNGPLFARGRLAIDGAADDMDGVAFRAALCRCGRSQNKPFCDNSHEKAGFVDRGAVGQSGKPLEKTGGELRIGKAADGPLLLNGNLTIMSGSGRVAWQGTKAALCRCGASANKPFCDGSHKTVGFKAD